LKPTDFLASDSTTASTFTSSKQSQSHYQNVEFPCVTAKSFKYYSDGAAVDTTVLIQGYRETL